jgi:hypothetical protein
MNKIVRSRLGCYRYVLCKFLCISVLFLNGCATAWKPSGSYYQTTTTKVSIVSVPDGKVFINNNYVGDTPIVHTVQYEKQIEKKSREVSYWITQPGWSLLFSICSLGIYIPFSLIPVDVETSLQPTDSFRNNKFNLQIVSEGYRTWQKNIICSGDDKLSIDTTLERKGVDE